MGNLLRALAPEDGCFSPPRNDLFLDFENAEPSPDEQEVYDVVKRVLERSKEVLEDLQTYRGASKEIRDAISNPIPDTSQRVRGTLLPLVQKLRAFYDFSLEIDRVVPLILRELISGNMSPRLHLETQQALVKQFAEILEFVMKFDELKMTLPAIQNDFSYYRRMLSRDGSIQTEEVGQNQIGEQKMPAIELPNELAGRMSLFYANPAPMLKTLSDATTKFVNETNLVDNTSETLGTMAVVCQRMIENPDLISRFKREETYLFVLRVIVGLVVLYDHVHPVGAFVKNAHLDIKGCVKVLKDQPPALSETLLNALRYTTRHFRDETTPKHIKTMLAVSN